MTEPSQKPDTAGFPHPAAAARPTGSPRVGCIAKALLILIVLVATASCGAGVALTLEQIWRH